MFDAIQRLRRLRAGLPIIPTELEQVEVASARAMIGPSGERVMITSWTDLPGEWLVFFEERAAIREYEGGQAREHSEAEALKEVVVEMTIAGWKEVRCA